MKYGTHLYYINSVNNEGCIASTEQRVEVINCSVQKGISPNGDGLNDAFDLTNYHPLEVSIYNRYGKQVYHHANGYNNQWTGQDSAGKSLPDGTYYYRIVTVSEELTGYVYLLREVK
ncbi:gliding motility-associated C-terminal domain-containing protein [Myroides ceti]|uniref:Gliding motility-associated C-terminal domain-containing protein n=1 Tax=Paenimyroides ceti TaxID=395087 RepID=A0ABT8D2L0_9FLAO|nr:gliding motility-associated C-terminal domain-containing protein [Paenimyroides ceti]MDN3709552.1 gliding motility-associated C-terminal domain-containing protein [Paenimyroides ceti]